MISGLQLPLLKEREFKKIRELAYRRFGLDLNEGKQSLVSSRLSKLIRQGGFNSFEAYYDHVVSDASGQALVTMIDCLTTNHTSFLREPDHFRFLAKRLLPELRKRAPIRIWSAASSTGEEPYSILFTVLSETGLDPGSVEILATDISTRVLDTARRGLYPAERIATMPPDWVGRFFKKAGGLFQVKPEYCRLVRFERLNLIEKFSTAATYSVIFCRNVMIYFDRATRSDLVQRLSLRLDPGGHLFVGHAESLIGIEHALVYVQPAVYRKLGSVTGGGR